jgi:hypothetical protein
MIVSDYELQTRGNYSQAEDLKTALECESLQKILHGQAGAFSSRYWFINEYTNYVNLLSSNPSLVSAAEGPKNIINLKLDYDFIENIAQFIEMIFRKMNRSPVDILFISRGRMVKIKTKSGHLEGDYVFYSVMSELEKGYSDLTLAMYLMDDSYLKYQYATPLDILRSALWALDKLLRWTFQGRKAREYLQTQGCGYAARFAMSYFRFRPLFRNALLGYSLKNLFEAKKPKVIVSNDDCMYTRPLSKYASSMKFLVLQSARMVEYGEACRNLIFQEPGLLPDYFLASGNIFGEIKERWHIAERVIVTGLPRYDILSHVHDVYSRQEFLDRYNLNVSNKIVYWSTQCHVLSQEENASNFRAIFGAMKSLVGVSLVIKQHPSEPERFTEEIIRQIKDYGINAILTAKDSDTYEQLFICDLMITRHSTTAMEAVALSKPVIILNLSGKPDPVEYVQEGVAIGIYNSDDLCPAIKTVLADDSEMSAQRKRYIEKYLYKIDGQSTQRVIDIIIKSLHEL